MLTGGKIIVLHKELLLDFIPMLKKILSLAGQTEKKKIFEQVRSKIIKNIG